MTSILEFINGFVWGIPAMILILGAGIYYSLRTGFAQIRLIPAAIRLFGQRLRRGKINDGVSPFQALCTALAATVGTGNLAGVAGAISIGGPGAIFWMWICGFLGMILKYAEATLAIRFRRKENEIYIGGPMYMIRYGLGQSWMPLAELYAFFGVVAAFGVGNCTQINAVLTGVNSVVTGFGGSESFGRNLLIGIVLGMIVTAMLLGGARRIGLIAERLVPFAAVAYLLLSTGVLVLRSEAIPQAFASICSGAFSPKAVTGGVIGSAFQSMRVGISRGVFTNEAGMGTASIAHASAKVNHPAEQGLLGMIEVFLDTLVICTMTALVIICSGVPIPYGADPGLSLTVHAFSSIYGDWISVVITLLTCCFAFATVLGWGLYGTRCAQFLFGPKSLKVFPWIQGITVVFGAIMNTGIVWFLSETVNGMMVIPNLIALILLSPELVRLTKEFSKGQLRKLSPSIKKEQ